MLKIQMIGHLGRDCVVQQHGTDSVINFSLCHTDKYKDASGQKYEKATWVSCSWWVESTNVAQYLKKGTLIWAEGIPEAKNWKDKQGESQAFLNMRVIKVELLGGKREGSPIGTMANPASTESSSDDDLPF
jgi:single-strand DNA-binding protein